MKQDARSRKSLISFGAVALLALGAATAQVAFAQGTPADPGTAMIDHSGSYPHEVQSCMSGMTQQDRATCLKEARNAHADKTRGVLYDGGNLQANAMARCNVFTDGEDKAACEARVLGMGETSGSVAQGGVLREAETVVLPSGEHNVTIQAQTDNPVVLVPDTTALGDR